MIGINNRSDQSCNAAVCYQVSERAKKLVRFKEAGKLVLTKRVLRRQRDLQLKCMFPRHSHLTTQSDIRVGSSRAI